MKLTKKAILEAIRSLPKGEDTGEADAVTVGGFKLWRVRHYAMPGQNRRFSWKWIYEGSHPDQQWKFGGTDSMHTMADIVIRLNRKHIEQGR